MDEGAIIPESDNLLDMSEVVESNAIDSAHEDEQTLASLNASKGWQRISEKMREDIQGLYSGSKLNVTAETPIAEIGQKYLIASLVAAHLQTYLDMVDGATKATVEYESRRNKSNQ